VSELRGIYTLWKREVLRLLREKTRLVSSVVTPILWLVIFGTGLGMSVGPRAGYNYQEFLSRASSARRCCSRRCSWGSRSSGTSSSGS